MARSRKGPKEPAFEEALERLETIVQSLEKGDLPLEESLRLFEEGVGLTRLCTARLEEAQRRVDVLARTGQGDLKLTPFEPPDEDPDDADGPGRT
jgi:exodeoxyribonuclease VII small subunit